MESPISSIRPTSSIPGIESLPLSTSDNTIHQTKPFSSKTIISTDSPIDSPNGEHLKFRDSEKQLPTAEQILNNKTTKNTKRTLKMTNEDFFQWRQILGNYKKYVKDKIYEAYD